MNKVFEKFKSLPDKKRNIFLVIICGISLVLLLIVEFSETDNIPSPETDSVKYAKEYTESIEKELCNLLEEVDGAGKVEVMITLESCYENVYAKGYSSNRDSDEGGAKAELSEEYIIVKSGSGTEECLVVKVYEPIIKGVAVVAEGADDIQVQKAITETVCALFDISSNKVSVIKKYKE